MLSSKVFQSGLNPQASTSICNDVLRTVTATGTNQATAYGILYAQVSFSTVAAGTGCILPGTSIAADSILIYNGGANDLSVYPEVGASINALATNAAYTVLVGYSRLFIRESNTHWVVEEWAGATGVGTVTSVALAATPTGIFDVSGSPITTSGTITLSLDTQAANIVLAGPTTGAAAVPSFRSLVAADLPTGTATGGPFPITRLLIGDGTSAITTNAGLTFDGTTLSTTGLTNTGNTALGNASGDTYSITAGTWTVGANYVSTRAMGTAAAGTTIAAQVDTTFTGDAGGTTHIIGQRIDVASQGANVIANSYALQARATHSGSTTLTGLQIGLLGQASLASTGGVATGIGLAGIISGGGSNTMTVGASLAALSPILTSANITTINGLRVQDLGHATRTGTVIGVELLNQTSGSVPLVAGVRSAITSGTARWFLYDTGGANSALTGNLRIGSTTAPTVALDVTGDAIISGNSTWGDAAADTLTINAATWTLPASAVTATTTAGTVAAGTVKQFYTPTTVTGDAGGTTNFRAIEHEATWGGGNAGVQLAGLRLMAVHNGTATLSNLRSINAATQVTNSGNATGAGITHSFTLSSSGGITNAANYQAPAPTLSSTGAIGTHQGFLAGNLGHATLVTNAIGFDHVDFTGSLTLTAGYRSQMNSGTGKWAFLSIGTANSGHAGSFRFGSVVAPVNTVDITGTLAVSGNATLGDANTDAHTINGTIRLQGYTVATLPAAGTAGRRAYVTDALAPAYGVAVAGGGAIVIPVFDNGAAWITA